MEQNAGGIVFFGMKEQLLEKMTIFCLVVF